jgi:hypothetical protein
LPIACSLLPVLYCLHTNWQLSEIFPIIALIFNKMVN